MQKTVSILFILGLFVLKSVYSIGQNLVPNPSFETVNTCNVSGSFQASQAFLEWKRINSADFFNTCFSDPSFAPPTTYAGLGDSYYGNGMVVSQ